MAVSTRFPTVFGAGWTTPSNMGADDNTDATAGPGKNATITSRVGTFGFDGDIPVGATINTVKLIFEYFVSTQASVAHFHSTPVVGGVTQTLREDQTEPLARTVITIDHTADRAWTRADLLNGTLEWDIGAHRGNSNTAVTFNCDYVKCEVDYTAGPTEISAIESLTLAAGEAVFGAATMAVAESLRLGLPDTLGAAEARLDPTESLRVGMLEAEALRQLGDAVDSLRVAIDPETGQPVPALSAAESLALQANETEAPLEVRLDGSESLTVAVTDALGSLVASLDPSETLALLLGETVNLAVTLETGETLAVSLSVEGDGVLVAVDAPDSLRVLISGTGVGEEVAGGGSGGGGPRYVVRMSWPQPHTRWGGAP